MFDSSNLGTRPAVSIILPTYNRAKFLPQAFASIRGQTFADWELIVVDDGSTDDTGDLLASLGADVGARLRYIRQENQGPNAARVTGLRAATGPLVAFFDSDDCWLPHHLKECVDALAANPEVDWVWGASQIEELESGKVLSPNSFYDQHGAPLPFLALRARAAGRLRIIDDPAVVRCAILGELNCGLQGSVVRADVFQGGRFCYESRNIAVDQLIVIKALQAAVRFAYFDDVHVLYRVHAGNSSAAAATADQKTLRVLEDEAWCFEELARDPALTAGQRRAAYYRWGSICFWAIGYTLYWQYGLWSDADRWFRKGLWLWPWDCRCWKTYILARLRARLGPRLSSRRSG